MVTIFCAINTLTNLFHIVIKSHVEPFHIPFYCNFYHTHSPILHSSLLLHFFIALVLSLVHLPFVRSHVKGLHFPLSFLKLNVHLRGCLHCPFLHLFFVHLLLSSQSRFFKQVDKVTGALVGSGTGALVGSLDLVTVGALVGASVGDLVGLAVGAAVGASVGLTVGGLVGASVGLSVGLAVGASVTAMGDAEGDAEGNDVGDSVGDEVATVGAEDVEGKLEGDSVGV